MEVDSHPRGWAAENLPLGPETLVVSEGRLSDPGVKGPSGGLVQRLDFFHGQRQEKQRRDARISKEQSEN